MQNARPGVFVQKHGLKGDELKDAKQRLARANDRIPLLDYWGPVPGLAHPAAGPAANGSAAVPEPRTAGPCADPGRTAGFFAFLLLAILSLGSWELFAAAGWIWSTAVLILISWAVTGACLDWTRGWREGYSYVVLGLLTVLVRVRALTAH